MKFKELNELKNKINELNSYEKVKNILEEFLTRIDHLESDMESAQDDIFYLRTASHPYD